MITCHSVNEVLWSGILTPEQQLAYLEYTQDAIEDLYEALTITEADYVYLMECTTTKAKWILKNNPDAFKTNQK